MIAQSIPNDAAALTAKWLTSALNAPVCAVALQPIGEDEAFTGGALFRLELSYSGADRGPRTIVAKLAPRDAALRRSMAKPNAREVDYYAMQDQTGSVPAPRCYYCAFDPATDASILLLEDLGHYKSVLFTQGCDDRQANSVVEAMARIHAENWQSGELSGSKHGHVSAEFDFAAFWALYPRRVSETLAPAKASPALLELGEAFAANVDRVAARLFETEPMTRLHLDAHSDNILFKDAHPHGEARLVDWQLTGQGRGAVDLGYFLISSLDPALRRRHEAGLIERYARELRHHGVCGYGAPEIWQDYRASAAWKLFVTVVATCLLDNSSSHKTAWRQTDLSRLSAFVDDHRITAKDIGL